MVQAPINQNRCRTINTGSVELGLASCILAPPAVIMYSLFTEETEFNTQYKTIGCPPMPMGLKGGRFCLPEVFWQCLETFLVVGGCNRHLVVEAWGPADFRTIHKATKNSLAPNVSSVESGKPCSR